MSFTSENRETKGGFMPRRPRPFMSHSERPSDRAIRNKIQVPPYGPQNESLALGPHSVVGIDKSTITMNPKNSLKLNVQETPEYKLLLRRIGVLEARVAELEGR